MIHGVNRSSNDQLCALLRGEPASPPAQDLDRLVAAAVRHGIHALLFQRLTDRAAAGGEPLLDALRPAVHRSVSLAVQQDTVTAGLLGDLREQAIPFLVFKGTPLAYQLYPSPYLRPRVDIDLMVDLPYCDLIRDWLISRHYVCGPLVKPFSRGCYLTSQFNAVSDTPTEPLHVLDIHWQVSNRYALAAPLSFDMLFEKAESFDGLGIPLRCPSPLHSLLIACLHWAAEPDRRLIWLYDIHLLVSRLDTPRAHELLALAARTRLLTVVRHLLRECQSCFATPLTPPLADELAHPSAAARCDPARLLLRRPDSSLRAHMADFLSIRDARERARMVSAVLFPPSSYLDLQGVAPRCPLPLRHALRLTRPLWVRFSQR